MMVEILGYSTDVYVIIRVVAVTLMIYVAWRVSSHDKRLNHIEAQTENNFRDLQIKLADAIGVAEDSVIRDHDRNMREEEKDGHA